MTDVTALLAGIEEQSDFDPWSATEEMLHKTVTRLIGALEAVEELCVIAETEFDGRPRKPFMIQPDAIRAAVVEALREDK